MVKNTSDSEIKRAESMASDIQQKIQIHYMESGISVEYVKAKVMVPMTENVNMTFEIDVPYEMMDEDNTALLEYFVQHIYQPENGSYMTEAVNALVVEKERDLQKLQENLDNFEAEAFMRGDYDPFNENDNPIVKIPNMTQEKYTVVKPEDIPDTSIDEDDECNATLPYTGMATIGRNIDDNFLVVVTPDTGRNDAYFKYCNHKSYESCTAVIRLDFREVKYYNHKGDGKALWEIDNKERKALMKFLKAKPASKKGSAFNTNWEMTIWSWNDECGFTSDKDWDESFSEGCNPESGLFKKLQFVPLNTPIQDYTKLQFK